MGNLIALAFNRSWAANEVLKTLRTETALEDAFVVERAASGRCAVRRAFNHRTTKVPDCSRGGLWGELVRLLFLNSSLDLAIRRGGSALFTLIEEAAENRVLRAVKPYRGRLLKTSLSGEAERRFQARSCQPTPAQPPGRVKQCSFKARHHSASVRGPSLQ
jgi:uncharacterized membrane protein